jgi:hypothetical protein
VNVFDSEKFPLFYQVFIEDRVIDTAGTIWQHMDSHFFSESDFALFGKSGHGWLGYEVDVSLP